MLRLIGKPREYIPEPGVSLWRRLSGAHESNLFHIWRHSRRDQLIIFAVVIASLPFYFASLDLPRRIVNEAIQGRAFERGQQTARFPTFSLELPQWLGGWQVFSFEGIEVDRLGLLYGLSGMFLLLVIINGAFKYWINVAKERSASACSGACASSSSR